MKKVFTLLLIVLFSFLSCAINPVSTAVLKR